MGNWIEGEPTLSSRRIVAKLGCGPGMTELVNCNADSKRDGKRGESDERGDRVCLELAE